MKNLSKHSLKVCLVKGIGANYDDVRAYAVRFKKYNNLLKSDIDEVVSILREYFV